MATLLLVSIDATPALATRNTANAVAQPGVPIQVWTSGGNFRDPAWPDGSTQPVTFRIPALNTAPFVPALTWEATCVFTQQYAGQQYSIVASLPIGNGGAMVPVLRSTGSPVVPAIILNPPPLVQLQWNQFILDPSLNIPVTSPLPLRLAGDFQWSLSFAGHGALPEIVDTTQTTRLEFNWAMSSAPDGPISTNNTLGITRVKLDARYPIALCRLFFPFVTEIIGIQNIGQVYGRLYARRTVLRVWTWGNPMQPNRPYYDTISGASSYNVSLYGGSFNLAGWMAGSGVCCNCHDLAAIVQLGCCLLVDENSNELLNSRWVGQSPNAYIESCLLYGWGLLYPLPNGVNNPFFNDAKAGPAYIPFPTMTGRKPFGNHAWIEIQAPLQPETRWVLDATTAIPTSGNDSSPEIGLRTRPEYATAHIDATADPTGVSTGNTNAAIRNSKLSTGNCYVNNTWWLDDPSPANIGRVGVVDAKGTRPPRPLKLTLHSGLPYDMKEAIKSLLAKGRNFDSPSMGFNDSTVANDSLIPVIVGPESTMALRSRETLVSEEITVLRMTFSGARYSATREARLHFEIQTFTKTEDAEEALVHALTGYQTPNLANCFQRPSPALGEISLIAIHGHDMHVVLGNQYLSMRLASPAPEPGIPDVSEIEQLQLIAQRLVAYLAAHTLPPGEHRKPDLSLSHPSQDTICVGDAFTVEAQGDDFAIVEGASENNAAVICAGQQTGTQQIKFYAVGKGEAELVVHVAHKETLVPGTKRLTVTVEAAG